MKLKQQQNQSIHQLQRLVMLPQMQQALLVLQLPIMELTSLIEMYLVENPLIDDETSPFENDSEEEEAEEEFVEDGPLRFDDQDLRILQHLDDDFRDFFSQIETTTVDSDERETPDAFIERHIPERPSLYQHLMQQAEQTFDQSEDFEVAKILIGNFDSRGFLLSSWDELAFLYPYPVDKLKTILKVIQTFDPVGVGATSLQESLSIQLYTQGKGGTVAAKIVSHHYDDLVHHRLVVLRKVLHCSAEELNEALHEISMLDLHPGGAYSSSMNQTIIPDIVITQMEDGKVLVTVNGDVLPPIKLNPKYLEILKDTTATKETKQFLKEETGSFKWLLRIIRQRNDTLQKLAQYLVKIQGDYLLNPNGKLLPMTMSKVAEAINVNESTIVRAVANKYIDCPRGMVALRSLFSSAYESDQGEKVSAQTVRDLLLEIITKENKTSPFSDAALAKFLKERGIPCARRTVTKYREELNLGNAQQRRKTQVSTCF